MINEEKKGSGRGRQRTKGNPSGLFVSNPGNTAWKNRVMEERMLKAETTTEIPTLSPPLTPAGKKFDYWMSSKTQQSLFRWSTPEKHNPGKAVEELRAQETGNCLILEWPYWDKARRTLTNEATTLTQSPAYDNLKKTSKQVTMAFLLALLSGYWSSWQMACTLQFIASDLIKSSNYQHTS